MSEQKPPEGSVTDEFRTLAKNLIGALQAAWESPERKRLTQEIESGLQELGSTLKREAQNVGDTPAAQRIKTEADRIRTGQTESKVRQELISALRTVNSELEKAAQRMSGEKSGEMPGEGASEGTGEQPSTDVSGASFSAQVREAEGGLSPESEKHREVHPDDVEADKPASNDPAPSGKPSREEIHPDDF